jgi:Phosphatidylethanolamine-binding protein
MMFRISSPAFADGQRVPTKYTADGDDISPPLDWSDAPTGAKSCLLVVEDPDAPSGTFYHWGLYNLQTRGVPEGFASADRQDDIESAMILAFPATAARRPRQGMARITTISKWQRSTSRRSIHPRGPRSPTFGAWQKNMSLAKPNSSAPTRVEAERCGRAKVGLRARPDKQGSTFHKPIIVRIQSS